MQITKRDTFRYLHNGVSQLSDGTVAASDAVGSISVASVRWTATAAKV